MKRIFKISVVIILIIFVKQSYSCDCPFVSFKDQWNGYFLIFKGRVIDSRTIKHYGIFGKEYNLFDVKIENLYKGQSFKQGDTISILNIEGYPCNYYLSLNSEYLIFTNPGEVTQIYLCSATTNLDKLEDGNHPLYNKILDSVEFYKSNEKVNNIQEKGKLIPPTEFKEIISKLERENRLILTFLILSGIANIILILVIIKKKRKKSTATNSKS